MPIIPPDSSLADAPEYTAKVAIGNLLQSYAPLQGRFLTYLTYEGDRLDEAEADDLPRPFFRLRAYPGPSKWFAAGQHKFPVFFSMEIGIDGTSDREILRLWHAIRIALSPMQPSPFQDTAPGQTVLNYMMDNGLATWEIEEAAYGVKAPADGSARWMYGTALMAGALYVNT